jgi:flagellar protein FlaF
MLAAARLNWRLWTIIQSDLLDPHSAVPIEVRSNVLSLARFVDTRTLAFLSDPRPEMLDVLISINREMAGGLYAEPAAPREPVPASGTGVPVAAAARPTLPQSIVT